MKELIKVSKTLFSGWSVLFFLILYTGAAGGYFYIISKNLVGSLVVGVISSFFLFYAFNLLNSRVQTKAQEMAELNKYVTSVVFYLKTGKNVLHALQATLSTSGELIKEDIEQAINSIIDTGELDLSSFKRHKFPSLDIFHNNLNIKFEQGGEADTLFRNSTKDINYEITKRDELRRKKGYVAQQEYMMTGLSMLIPVILVIVTGDLYDQYLSVGVTVVVLAIYVMSFVANLFFLQKKKSDISVTL